MIKHIHRIIAGIAAPDDMGHTIFDLLPMDKCPLCDAPRTSGPRTGRKTWDEFDREIHTFQCGARSEAWNPRVLTEIDAWECLKNRLAQRDERIAELEAEIESRRPKVRYRPAFSIDMDYEQ